MTSTAPTAPPVDTVGAFVGAPAFVPGAPGGPLAGRTFAVKDVIDVAGQVTGAGNPTFRAGRPPATANAPAVDRLLAAGATLVGRTVSDELAWSLAGTNAHDGTPRNVAAPDRVPGGSSSGSAAAVAAGLVDLALGTDTGGSIRVPASYCGVLGWRPSHGAVPVEGVVPLAPSFDTVGLLARDGKLLAAAGEALLRPQWRRDRVRQPPVVLLADEVLASVPLSVCAAVVSAAGRVARALDVDLGRTELGIDLDAAAAAFRVRQAWEAWRAHGAWVRDASPSFGPGVGARFRAAAAITDDDVAAVGPVIDAVAGAMADATAGGVLLALPATSGAAPPRHVAVGERDEIRAATLRVTCLVSLAGVPAVSLPLSTDEDLPMGLLLVAATGADTLLLDVARRLVPA